jgi:hypothetical protein
MFSQIPGVTPRWRKLGEGKNIRRMFESIRNKGDQIFIVDKVPNLGKRQWGLAFMQFTFKKLLPASLSSLKQESRLAAPG